MTVESGDVLDLRERVREEMRIRGWSIRKAALHSEGAISNTGIGDWLNGGDLGPKVRVGLSTAFGWPLSWPEDPPSPVDAAQGVLARIAELEATVETLRARLDAGDRQPPAPGPPSGRARRPRASNNH